MVFSMRWQPNLAKVFTPGKTHREVTDSDIFLCHFDIRRCWCLLFQYVQQKQPKKIKTEKSSCHIIPPSRLFLIVHLKFSWTSSASASACRMLKSKACATTPSLLPLWCQRILGAQVCTPNYIPQVTIQSLIPVTAPVNTNLKRCHGDLNRNGHRLMNLTV